MNIFQIALKKNIRHKVNLFLIFILPFPLLLIPGNEFSLPFGMYLYGMLILYTAFLLARPIAEDRMKGMILRIASSPVHILRYLGGHLSAYLLLLIFQITLFLGASALVHQLNGVVYLYFFGLYLSYAAMSTALAVAWNSLFRSFNLSFSLFAGFASIMCLVSGVTMPLSLIPLSIQKFVMFLPTYWLPYGIDAIHGERFIDLVQAHAILIAYATIFLLAGTRRKL